MPNSAPDADERAIERWTTLEQAGASVRVHSSAPDPARHRPSLGEDAIRAHLDRKIEERERRIESLRLGLGEGGSPVERVLAAIVHDTERAPRTTNRRQLAEIGVVLPRDVAALEPDEVGQCLWTVVYGLARLGIFLLGTDHLDDRALLAFLSRRILDEEVSDVPPTSEMSEFIDLGLGSFGADAEPEAGIRDGDAGPDDAEPLGSGSDEKRASDARSPGPRAGEPAAGDSGEPPDGLAGPFEFAPSDDEDSFERGGPGPRPAWPGAGRDALLPRPLCGGPFVSDACGDPS